MPILKGLEWTFDTKAPLYAKLRPGYVPELYEKIFQYNPIHASSHVVEIGIGGGQATLPFLQTGCQLTAVEYGSNFSDLCREKFKEFPGFSVITGKFEDVDFEADSCDLVFSASAFHWIPEEAGCRKVFSMLKSGGVFARFANRPYPDKSNPELSDAIQKLYETYYYKFHKRKPETPQEYTAENARAAAQIPLKYGFQDIEYALFHRIRTFSPSQYTALLETYSDHMIIEESIRKEFFSKIQEAIHQHGGKIHIYDTMDLQLARKP